MRYLFFFLLFSSVTFAQYSIKEIQTSKKALNYLENKNTAQALQVLSEGLKLFPESDLLHFNLGHVFLADNKIESAIASFKTAQNYSNTNEIKFSSSYNIGLIYQLQKKNDEAILNYQQALDFNPESKETKINIELMTQQQSGGEGDNQNQDAKSDSRQDQKDKGQQSGDSDDKQKKEDQADQNNENNKQPPKINRGQAPKPQFNSKELTPSDVNKILGELKQQEQKIRSEYNKQSKKEKINGKDW